MKIGIVGPISKDEVIMPDGSLVQRWGAVAYSALVLAKLLEGTGDLVVCLSHLSAEDTKDARDFLRHPNIIIPAVDTDHEYGTKIRLHYSNSHDRTSRQIRTMTPITAPELRLLSDCEYLILMPLNETDIPLEAVREYRRSSRAQIFLDIHGLITGVDGAGRRFKKAWADSGQWLGNIDFLKMNDKEATWAAGRSLSGQEDYAAYACSMVDMGLAACWITFGDQSSLVAWRRNERLFWASVPVVDVGRVVDTVGCGDSASAGFVYSFAKLHSPLMAVVLGNTFGSVKASLLTVDQFPSKPVVRGMVYRHYRDYLHALLDEFLTQEHLIVREVKGDQADEGSLHRPDGHGYRHGADHAGSGDSQGPNAPWA